MRFKIIPGVLLVCVMLVLVMGMVAAQDRPPGGGGPTPLPPPNPGGGGPNNNVAPDFDESYEPVPNTYNGVGHVSMGEGDRVDDFSVVTGCTTNERFVEAATGIVIAEDGTEWIVPMQMTIDGAASVDIFNNCTSDGDNPDYLDELETVVIDPDGDVITATIFADNYFELYVNGEYVVRDTIGFVPFNSSAARFQASYPMTIALHLADWETHFGLGMEYDSYNIGDAGFIMSLSDGTVTNADWKCRTVYIAPLDDPACVIEDENGIPDSSACSAKPQCSSENAEACRALHYELPDNWTAADFDDSAWPNASLYDASEVTNQRGYVDYADWFGDAAFIWSQNLDLDNQVVCRLTIDGPGQ